MDDDSDRGAGPPTGGDQQDFEASYVDGTPPWDIGRPQRAFAELADRDQLAGRVLDVGCGTGEHVLLAASRGLDATGIDLAPTAIDRSRHKAAERGLHARFIIGDVLELDSIFHGELFDTVTDCGLFHVLSDEERPRFTGGLRAVLQPGGRYFMLCFSDAQPGDWGPRRIRAEEINETFANGFTVESIDSSQIETTFIPEVSSWLATIVRT